MNILITGILFAAAYAITLALYLYMRKRSSFWGSYFCGTLLGLAVGWMITYTMFLLHKYMGI